MKKQVTEKKEEVFFSFIINDNLKRFSIIGAMSAEEERELTGALARHNGRRLNSEQNTPIKQQVDEFVENNNEYRFVPVNQVFPDSTHIHITAANWSDF